MPPLTNKELITAKRFADLILDIGTFLLASGAHSGRVVSNIKRMAITWGFEVDLQPTFKGLVVCVRNVNDPDDSITLFKQSPSHVVHLEVLTRISHLSWDVYDNGLTIEETEKAFRKIKRMTHYSWWVVSIAVGFSCAGLCLLSSGDIYNALIAWIAAFLGSAVRFKIASMDFNAMISIGIAAFITTLITGIATIQHIGASPETAMATAVLYLIPGVPLVNCIIDIIEGYLSSAMNRAMFAGFILLCIATGMTLSITMLGIDNFKL